MTSVSLIIPSYGRPDDLAACIASAQTQTEPFDEIITVLRDSDTQSHAVALTLGVQVVTVTEPGVLAAMIAGVAAATGEVVAFTDDDARLPQRHAAGLRAHFVDPGISGVGGRDVLYDNGQPRPTSLTRDVGRLTWYGRVIGNHHRGTGPTREVFMLKGVNAAYRRESLAFPLHLRGSGAQPHFEVAVGTWIARHQGTLLYDPELSVEHHPAPRLGDDQRTAPSQEAIFDSAYNLLRSLAWYRQTRRLCYVLIVGDSNCPGVLRSLVAVVRGERAVLQRRRASWQGSLAAWRERNEELLYTSPSN